MKIENPTKLDILFKGGGLINFPTKHLKYVDIEPIDNSDDEDNENVTLMTYDEYDKQHYVSILTKEEEENINFDNDEDLTLDVFKIESYDVEEINNNISNNKKSKIRISGGIIFIDKFEVLNEYVDEESGNEFQTIKIHIHKTAVMLPQITTGGR